MTRIGRRLRRNRSMRSKSAASTVVRVRCGRELRIEQAFVTLQCKALLPIGCRAHADTGCFGRRHLPQQRNPLNQ